LLSSISLSNTLYLHLEGYNLSRNGTIPLITVFRETGVTTVHSSIVSVTLIETDYTIFGMEGNNNFHGNNGNNETTETMGVPPNPYED
jgi:hypothetical protein